MEFTKEKLLSIISEESSFDLDEMGKYWDKGGAISRPLKFEDGTIYGHDMLVNPTDPNSGRVNVIFTCDIVEFVNTHPDLVKQLREQYGNIKWSDDVCPKYNPHRKTSREYRDVPGEDGPSITTRKYTPSGESYDVSEKIKRKFNPIILKEFGSETSEGREFEDILNKRSIPAIIPGNPKFEDRYHDSWTNEKIFYRVHSFNSYESANDFLQTVLKRIKGSEIPEANTTYLARQFNTLYRNWEETRQSEKRYEGKTDVFQLDVRGYKELNLDVSLKMVFEIEGEKMGESFNWTIRMKNKFGRKRPDEIRIPGRLQDIQLKEGGYLDDAALVVNKTVQLDPTKEYDTIMDDYAVVEGLRQAIYDFKELIKSINPKSALKLATFKKSDIQRVNEDLDKIIKNVIKELK